MRIKDVYDKDLHLSFGEVALDREMVSNIQLRLKNYGYSIGTSDGLYGSLTATALADFIHSWGESDAEMNKTIAKLLIEKSGRNGGMPELATPELVSAILQCPLSDSATYLPGVLSALREQGILDRLTLIAIIATIGVETGGFRPINEFGSRQYFIDHYEGRCSDLGNCFDGDGPRYHGRGFIQLTGRANYRKYGNLFGVNLEDNPDLALDPIVSAKVLARYFFDREVDIAANAQNWELVRKKVNGGLNGFDDFMFYVNRSLVRLF
jgi:predicted chitinase